MAQAELEQFLNKLFIFLHELVSIKIFYLFNLHPIISLDRNLVAMGSL